MKIVVCGSMTASKEMIEAKEKLEDVGHQVVLPEFTHDYAKLDSLKDMHLESAQNKVQHDLIKKYYYKIQDGDAVLVINVERKGVIGYIGGNTLLEMGFALILDKPIYLMYEIPEMGYKDEILAMQPILLNGDLNSIKEKINV
jgi:hypothetical protein